MNDKQIRKTKVVNCPVRIAWQKWTTHDGLLTFFGRDNNIELRLGGPFEIYFLLDNPPGLRGSEGCKVISYLPERMLSFTWNAPPEHMEIRNLEHKTWVVVTFRPINDDKTEVELIHIGWLSGHKWDLVYQYFDKAWDTVLDRFERSCKSA